MVKYRLNWLLQFYYSIVFLVIALGIGVITYRLWLNGSLNLNVVTNIIESNLHLENVKNEKGIEKIKDLVQKNQIRDAVFEIKKFHKISNDINSTVSSYNFENLNEEINKTKQNLNNLLDYSNLRSIVFIFNKKIDNFIFFVKKNKWKTLTRTSRRIQLKIPNPSINTKEFFQFNKLNKFHKSISKDIKNIEKIVKNSFLSIQNKKKIIERVKNLSMEVDMMGKYLFDLGLFYTSFEHLNSIYLNWIDEVGPKIALKKIEIEKDNKYLVMMSLGILCFIIFSFGLGYLIHRINNTYLLKRTEFMALEAIKQGLVPFESNFNMNVGHNFKEELAKYRKYFHKRMSLGLIFQEATPFSAVLFDSNLNLIWANILFYEHFRIEKKETIHSLNWSIIRKETNLGEDDPVLMALKKSIAGIYQIQIKDYVNKKSHPYEMYVTPVQYAKQSRIMIFFYPLSNLEKSIEHQTKAIINPISQMLDAFIDNFSEKDLDKHLKREFEISGIIKIFEKMKNYNEFMNQQKQDLKSEIYYLKNFVMYKEQLKENLISLINDLRKNNESLVEKIKKSINTSPSLNERPEIHFKHSLTLINSLLLNAKEMIHERENDKKIIEENFKSLRSIDAVRKELKDLKSQMDNYGEEITQLIKHFFLFLRKENCKEGHLEKKIDEIKFKIKDFEKISICFQETVKTLDIVISKMHLISEKWENPDFDNFKNQLKLVENEFKDSVSEFDDLNNKMRKDNKMIRSSFKSFCEDIENSFILEEKISQILESEDFEKWKKLNKYKNESDTMGKNFYLLGKHNSEESIGR